MAPPISKEDLKETASIIADQIKADLVNQIKSELINDMKQIVEAEFTKITEKDKAESIIYQAELESLRKITIVSRMN